MRGKVLAAGLHNLVDRITPAHAGKSEFRRAWVSGSGDHPRACGEKSSAASSSDWLLGSPPRMRGKDLPLVLAHNEAGITPAHAGKSINLA